jgi:hypothetical protein
MTQKLPCKIIIRHISLILYLWLRPWLLLIKYRCGFWKNLNVDKFCMSNRVQQNPKLWGLWSQWILRFASPEEKFVVMLSTHLQKFSLEYVIESDQCVALELQSVNTLIYASTSYLTRRNLWADLTRLSSLDKCESTISASTWFHTRS